MNAHLGDFSFKYSFDLLLQSYMTQARYSFIKMKPPDRKTPIQCALLAQKNLAQSGMVLDGRAMAAYLKDKVRGRFSNRPEMLSISQLTAPRT
jgi:hypothetical protein